MTRPTDLDPKRTEPDATRPSDLDPKRTEPDATRPSDLDPAPAEPARTAAAQTGAAPTSPSRTGAASTSPVSDAADGAYALAGVTKTYRRNGRTVTALRDVHLRIEAGEHIAVQGPTGGGKSTLLQLLGALDRPDSGRIALGGLELSRAADRELARLRAERIGFVFQGFNLIPTLTAHENVAAALAPLGVPAARRDERAAEALRAVGLADRAGHRPVELSGGQQQRVAIARALVKDPRVLLADEPTGALDEDTRDEIMLLLEQQRAERGITLVVVTHDSAVARRADRRLRLTAVTLTER